MANAEEHSFRKRAWIWIRQHAWWIVPALGVLYILVWWLVPLQLYRFTGTDKAAKLEAITNTRTALLAGLIGVGALLTFWLNSRVYRVTAETLRVTEQGQITERYTKAIEQLGSGKLDVRLGGIYALERIAKDSERDHPTVVEVLSAFVREHSDPVHTESEPSMAKVLNAFLQGDSQPAVEQPDDKPKLKPTTDVRAAIAVLGRLPSRLDVPRADLTRADFAGAALYRANLSGFGLSDADLQGAGLMEANLQQANLLWANLRRAYLHGANLQDANLRQAHLHGANLQDANLRQAHLEGANLQGANLRQAHLEGANLQGANLRFADLHWANLEGANLWGAELEGANLRTANLQKVDLTAVRGLTREQLTSSLIDAGTLPFQPRESDSTETRPPDGQ
jgi:uncharacterized protein YjbI with pentapeptide repeats